MFWKLFTPKSVTPLATFGFLVNPVTFVIGIGKAVSLGSQLKDAIEKEKNFDGLLVDMYSQSVGLPLNVETGTYSLKPDESTVTLRFLPASTARKVVGKFMDVTQVRCSCGQRKWKIARKHSCESSEQLFDKPTAIWETHESSAASIIRRHANVFETYGKALRGSLGLAPAPQETT